MAGKNEMIICWLQRNAVPFQLKKNQPKLRLQILVNGTLNGSLMQNIKLFKLKINKTVYK